MREELINQNQILMLSFEFAVAIADYCDKLEAKKKYRLANQLFRSGTSIGANATEAQNAESKADFIHRIKIAAKEADETEYWLRLCQRTTDTDAETLHTLKNQLSVIMKILGKIISTSKRQQNHS